ncbi:MAG: methionine--tRNA ligase [Phycisphaerales bacterium]|nr:methionine--tRNA ligase [Phycisphaerales bacterium]NNM27097.1 methionine--tRNA ligase [Phycisphaerales bacterium]
MAQTRYITTPIYYVNDRPHIGHVYTTTVCDVWARFMRFSGDDVFFLTGTDEHGMKVEKSAQTRGIEPQALADENAAEFKRVMEKLDLRYDHFIRTTDPEHERQVASFVETLLAKDAVYVGDFEGWYDEGQEEYYTETRARAMDFRSQVDQRPLVRAKEKNYYFRLSAFQEPLEAWFRDHPDFVMPESRRNEVLGRLREGLQDVPMSRTNFTWGIPMPGAPEHVIYVWIDALLNYATALGLGAPDGDWHRTRSKYWPADYHVIAKDILWFHAVIWPAILMALDLPLPKHIYCHSWWISEGQKMSKTLGNAIDLAAIDRYLDDYGHDMWRYYLVTRGPLSATDSDFTAASFHDSYNTDLVNTVGNCASRVTAMIRKYHDGVIPNERQGGDRLVVGDVDWPTVTAAAVTAAHAAMERFDLAAAVEAGLGLVRQVDAFINQTEPYKLAKVESERPRLDAVLYQCLEAFRIASLLLWPVIPRQMETAWAGLGLKVDPDAGNLAALATWGRLPAGQTVEKLTLYPRRERPEPAACSASS